MARLRTHNNRAKRILRRQIETARKLQATESTAAVVTSDDVVADILSEQPDRFPALTAALARAVRGRHQASKPTEHAPPLKHLNIIYIRDDEPAMKPHNLINPKPDYRTDQLEEIHSQNINPPARDYSRLHPLQEHKIYKSYSR